MDLYRRLQRFLFAGNCIVQPTIMTQFAYPQLTPQAQTLTPYVDADGQPPDVILAGSYYILINPFRSPAIAASVRLRAPNFCMMLFT
jgi:hypothetical protein